MTASAPPATIAPGLAPGGLVFDIWAGGQRVNRDAIPGLDDDDASAADRSEGAARLAISRLQGTDGPRMLVVYDGDDGHLWSISVVPE